MKKKNIIIASVLAIVVVGAVAMAQSDMLQGRFGRWDFAKIYSWRGAYVTLLASPVTSVHTSDVTSHVSSEVSSEVTSTVGTSKVASTVTSTVTSKVTSKVASGITSAVASAVTVPIDVAEKVRKDSITALTSVILESFAKDAYRRNPSAFILSAEQMGKLLEMYEKSSVK
ncbi:MAG: hypothetical protein WC924_03495 [Candidatus Gracilibacteria bacterium]